VKPDAQALAAPNHALSGVAMRLALARLGAALDCLERLLGQPAACPVPVPGAALLALCARMLSVDESLAGPGERCSSADAPASVLHCTSRVEKGRVASLGAMKVTSSSLCPPPGRAPPSASAFLELCAALPALHSAALRLMQTLLQVLHSL
jgi:hypothetical protein